MKIKLDEARSMFQMASPDLVEWRDQYRTGIPAIDYQHWEFIKLTNEVYRSCLTSDKDSQSAFLRAMRKVVDFVYHHFAIEEAILEQVEFPGLETHKRQHEQLVREVLDTVKSYEEGMRYIPNRFARLLKDWVQNHIGTADNEYMIYIRSREREGLVDMRQLVTEWAKPAEEESGGGEVESYRHHRFAEILLLCVVGMVRGVETIGDVYFFGLTHLGWLRKYLNLPNGIPRVDIMVRVLGSLAEGRFQEDFGIWLKGYFREQAELEIAGAAGTRRALRDVSIWVGENALVLGQVLRDRGEETGEYTAIPALLSILNLSGKLVTMSAHDYTRAMIHEIVSRGGEYLMFIGPNLPDLYGELEKMFGRRKPPEIKPSDWVEGTGEAEILLKPDIAPLPHRDRWQGLKNAGCLTEVWTVEKTSISDRRYFLTSLSDAAQILRGAKSIEGTGNRTHWTLGLRQKDGEEAPPRSEDQEQPGPAEANLEILKSYAARLIEAEGEKKYFGQELTAVRKRLYAAWSTDYLLKVLQNL